MTQWIYLTDMAPQAKILNPETGELRSIMSSAVKHRAPAGLRRYVLNELPGGVYEETGEVLPITSDLYDEMEESYHAPNSWNYDWPNVEVESMADTDPAMAAKIVERLNKSMAQHPYDFKVTGLQRRYLMYYSDGNHNSQQRFERLIPQPDSNPFRRSGALRRKYDFIYNSIMRDAGVPYPKDKQGMFGSLRPCLYIGPAWVVRFTLDDQDVLLERCRVYVTDEAEFICSDWCQRHDFSSYSNGINLQTGIYSFDGWVTGPCVIKNTESGKFKPANATFKRTAVRELMKKAPVAVPDFDTAFGKAKAAVDKYAKHVVTPAAPVKPDAGPITADVMAEAMAEVERILQEKAQAAAEAAAAVAPAPVVTERPLIARAPLVHQDEDNDVDSESAFGYVFEYKRCGDSAGYPVISAKKLYQGEPYLTVSESEFAQEEYNREYFIIDEDSPTGFWYGQQHPNVAELKYDVDQLNTHWWLYSAAVYFRDNLMPSPVETALMEA
jgi:hypothetical protein